MNDETVIGLVVTFILAQLGLFFDQRRNRKIVGKRQDVTDQKIDDVGATAETAAVGAAEAARPVMSGFTEKVLDNLESISTQVEMLIIEQREDRRRLNDHLDDHASADVRRG